TGVLGPEHLVQRRLRSRLLAGDDLRERLEAVVPHDLDVGERPRELLADQRILVPAEALGLLHDPPELLLVLDVLGRGAAAALVAERRHRDPPAVVEPA